MATPYVQPQEHVSRRTALAGALCAGGLTLMASGDERVASQPTASDCPRCGGLGRVPIPDAKPWCWIKGTSPPKWDAVVGERPCDQCHAVSAASIADDLKTQAEHGLEKNRHWERLTGWKLACAITRHSTIHTQLLSQQARTVGTAIETLTLHLKRVTRSLALAKTRPDTLEVMLLLEQSSWDAFRKVMEGLHTSEQLGESWAPARQLNAYDHIATPHLYETPETLRQRPPSCGATFIVARRQLNRATNWLAPFWLAEGFAAYGDHVVHMVNRWYTVYDVKQVPVGDWLAEARKLALAAQELPWKEIFRRELRDWEPADHVQTMAMVAFLLEAEPARFLDYLRRLKAGDDQLAALENSFGAKLGELEERWRRWLLARR